MATQEEVLAELDLAKNEAVALRAKLVDVDMAVEALHDLISAGADLSAVLAKVGEIRAEIAGASAVADVIPTDD